MMECCLRLSKRQLAVGWVSAPELVEGCVTQPTSLNKDKINTDAK
jgi:hypothetical protein